jgi:hypothetical protein
MQWLPKAKRVLANAEKTSSGPLGGWRAASRLRPCFRLTDVMKMAVKDVVKRVKREKSLMLRMEGTNTMVEVMEPITNAHVLQQQW